MVKIFFLIKDYHANLIKQDWLKTTSVSNLLLLLTAAAIVISVGMNFSVRFNQLKIWEKNHSIFQLSDGTPLFTTTDAASFLMRAKLIRDGENPTRFEHFRSYPNNVGVKIPSMEEFSPRSVELLPLILAYISEDSSAKSLLLAGNYMLIFTAVISALMIIISFGASGNWIFGAVAAAGGGLTQSYLARSSIGRIDNDQLNLGFFYLIIGLIVFASKAKTYRTSIPLAILSGAAIWLFNWWHSQPIFIYYYIIAFIWLELALNKDIKRTIINVSIFILFSGTLSVNDMFSDVYFSEQLSFGGLMFPNAFDTIGELKSLSFIDLTTNLSGSYWLFGLGIVGLFFWGIRQPVISMVYFPIAAFILVNSIYGNRVLYYAGPLLWFGTVYAIFITARFAYSRVSQGAFRNEMITLSLSGLGSMLVVWMVSNTNIVYAPTFSREIVQGLNNINGYRDADDKVVSTWWDYGYTSIFFNQLAVLHDGGSQTTPVTYYVAKALLSKSQGDAAEYQKYLMVNGLRGIADNDLSGVELEQKILTSSSRLEGMGGYFFLSKDMVKWMPSISKIGLWDLDQNSPVIRNNIQPIQMRYIDLGCYEKVSKNVFKCKRGEVNLNSGSINNQFLINGVSVSFNGKHTGGWKTKNKDAQFVVQIINNSGMESKFYIIPLALYQSTFNQLFFLGKFNKDFFELVEDGYPNYRTYRIK